MRRHRLAALSILAAPTAEGPNGNAFDAARVFNRVEVLAPA
jgi:hypothetical protein